jgi:hypothetical protein
VSEKGSKDGGGENKERRCRVSVFVCDSVCVCVCDDSVCVIVCVCDSV